MHPSCATLVLLLLVACISWGIHSFCARPSQDCSAMFHVIVQHNFVWLFPVWKSSAGQSLQTDYWPGTVKLKEFVPVQQHMQMHTLKQGRLLTWILFWLLLFCIIWFVWLCRSRSLGGHARTRQVTRTDGISKDTATANWYMHTWTHTQQTWNSVVYVLGMQIG